MDEAYKPSVSKEVWEQLEKDTARLLRGNRTPGSGNGYIKGDVISGEIGKEPGIKILAECKYRRAFDDKGFYFPLDLQMLEGIWNQSGRGEYITTNIPILVVQWGDGNRAIFLTLEDYKYLKGEPLPFLDYLPVYSRSKKIYWGDIHWENIRPPFLFHFLGMEIVDKDWMMISWQEMRDIIGMFEVKKKPSTLQKGLNKGKKLWKSRSFWKKTRSWKT